LLRFFVGLLLGVVLGGGATYVVLARKSDAPPAVAAVAAADAGVDAKGKKKRGKPGARRPGAAPGTVFEGDEADYSDEPIPELTAADLAQGVEGDSLKPRTRDVDLSAGAEEARDLGQDEIDGTFGHAAANISGCIKEARGAAPVTGRISVGVLVDPQGKVARTRVEAPAWLLRHGLYRCIRKEVATLRFPAVGKDTVVSVPFDLQ
jgi:hypothetical protein